MSRSLLRLTALVALVWSGCARDRGDVTAPPGPNLSLEQQGLGPALAAQQRHTAHLMATSGVVGTAVGLTATGRPAVLILTKADVAGLPVSLDGVPVVVRVTGEIVAIGELGLAAPRARIDPSATFARPVPIGISTGNEGQCSAGTISARVTKGGTVYALSNNHVYALENSAPLGSRVLQPGLYDTGCAFVAADTIGRLSEFQPISFTSPNTIDAAIASSSTALLGNATPSNGYGTPSSTTVAAVLGQSVQKYGRSSSLTRGSVTAINATVNVGYSGGIATFVNQIIVESHRAFIKPGDSGSLLVTNDANANPVGLLFAGTSSGKFAVANPIDAVLSQFGVSIDGK